MIQLSLDGSLALLHSAIVANRLILAPDIMDASVDSKGFVGSRAAVWPGGIGLNPRYTRPRRWP